MEKLAIFDVDYTLTKKETLVEFYFFMLRKNFKYIKYIPRTIKAAVFYSIGYYDLKKAKEDFISFVDDLQEEEVELIVKEFYQKVLSKIIYKDALNMMKKLKEEGCKIYLISASAEFYLKELYNIEYVDKVIGTKYLKNKGKYRGSIQGQNCKGEEKVKRLMEELKEENIEVDFNKSYMFSDSISDKPLFDLVGNPYLINFKKNNRTEIKVLNWK